MKKKISIIGLGYVGLPLYQAIAKNNSYNLVGFDTNKLRVEELKKGYDSNFEVKKIIVNEKNSTVTYDVNLLKDSDFFIIVVPTPINKKNLPDTSHLRSACKLISNYIKKNSIVIFESTVYPGLTEEICIPILKKNTKNLKFNIDFFCGYSPERINPGDKVHTIFNTPKIISGSNNYSMIKIKNLYKNILNCKIYTASSIKNAEAAKVLENTQRDVNIALMNEYLKISKKLNFNFFEVLKLASTKWNFNNYYPGLVGGHCIGVDPYYLIYKSKRNSIDPKVISSSRKTNHLMPNFYFSIIDDYFKKKIINNPSILFLGVSYKKNTNDLRNSLSIPLIQKIKSKYFNLKIYDPYIYDQLLELKEYKKNSLIKNLNENRYNLIIMAQDHDCYNFILKNPLNYLKKNGKFLDITNNQKISKLNIL